MSQQETLLSGVELGGQRENGFTPQHPRQQYEIIAIGEGVNIPTLMYQTIFLNTVKDGTPDMPVFEEHVNAALNHDGLAPEKVAGRRERAYKVTRELVGDRTDALRLGRGSYETDEGIKRGYYIDRLNPAQETQGVEGTLPSPDEVFHPGSIAWKFYRQQLIALALNRTPVVTDDIFMIYGSNSPRNRKRYEFLVKGVNMRLSEFGVRLVPQIPETPKPKDVLTVDSELTDEDLTAITDKIDSTHKFTTMDVRVLAKLISLKGDARIFPDDLARFMSQKTSGFAPYMTMLQWLIPLYNKTVLQDTDISIRATSGNFQDPEGYMVRYGRKMDIEERKKIVERRLIEQIKGQQGDNSYRVNAQVNELHQQQVDAVILKNNKNAAVVVLKSSSQMDGEEADEKLDTDYASAQVQWRLLQLLFGAGPVPKVRLNTELSSIDGLGGTMGERKKDTEMAAAANILTDSLRGIGLCVGEEVINSVSHYVLKKYHPNTYTRIVGEQALTLQEEESILGNRQRKRKAKHD